MALGVPVHVGGGFGTWRGVLGLWSAVRPPTCLTPRGDVTRLSPRVGVRRAEVRVLVQDLLMQLLQLRRRVDGHLVAEALLQAPVDRQRLGLMAGAIQRQHELRVGALSQRVDRHRGLELPEHLLMAPEREPHFHPISRGRLPQMLQPPRLGTRMHMIGELTERRPAPQPVRLSQQLRSLERVRPQQLPCLRHQPFEPRCIQPVGRQVRPIPVDRGQQRLIRTPSSEASVRRSRER
jgi:hypothetical protein